MKIRTFDCLGLMLLSASCLLATGNPVQYTIYAGSDACDPVSCYQSLGGDGTVQVTESALCYNEETPFVLAGTTATCTTFDPFLEAYTYENDEAYYATDLGTIVTADEISAGADTEVYDFYSGGFYLIYHMEAYSDCYQNSMRTVVPPPVPC